MVRKCSHCGNTGHNSRTCRGTSVVGGLRLFGVQLDISSSSSSSSFNNIAMMKKSFSMDCFCLPSISSPSPSSSLSSSRLPIHENSDKPCIGYLSDGLISPTLQEIRKKGVVWTEEEHRTFLAGLEKLGKGDWRGISRNFVTSRTPTQVASHAQKYFLRQATLNNKKRRSSLFDMVGSCNRVQSHVNNSKPSDPPIPAHFLGTTSSCHEAHHDTTLPLKGYMQSARDSRHCGVWVGSDDTTRPLLDLNSSSQDVKSDNQESNYSQLSSRPHAMSIWLYGSLNSQLKSSTTTNPISPNAAPDLGLELTLAAPRPMDQNKSSSSPLLIGPISVV